MIKALINLLRTKMINKQMSKTKNKTKTMIIYHKMIQINNKTLILRISKYKSKERIVNCHI